MVLLGIINLLIYLLFFVFFLLIYIFIMVLSVCIVADVSLSISSMIFDYVLLGFSGAVETNDKR